MEYPEEKALETWKADGATFSIIERNIFGLSIGAPYNGYVRFPSRPVKEEGYQGIMTYVPVHGGITYAEESEDGSMVYGFDCAHFGDENNPELFEIDWVKAECQRMASAISIAAAYEDEYLAANTREARAEVITEYHERLRLENIDFNIHNNFGALINAMFGEL